MIERAVQFVESNTLYGILTEPSGDMEIKPCGVLLLNAGLVHRAGPNRVYVKLARRLTEAGFTVLRFDFSGIGDSPSRTDALPFHEYAVTETQRAMRFLTESKDLDRFVLIGLCTGADVAFRSACADARVVGVVMINGIGLDPEAAQALNQEAQRQTQARYYRRRLFHPRSWLRVITGKSGIKSILRSVGSVLGGPVTGSRMKQPRLSSSLCSEFRHLAARGTHVLLILAEGSTALDLYHMALGGLKEVSATSKSLPQNCGTGVSPVFHHEPGARTTVGLGIGSKPIQVRVISDADHTFTLLWTQDALLRTIQEWLAHVPLGLQVGGTLH